MNSMNQQNPGFGQFMGGMMEVRPMPPMGAPPVPPKK